MYQSGDLKVYEKGKWNYMSDSRGGTERDEDGDLIKEYRDLKDGEAYLVHSCSEWVIGGEEQIKALIEDLQKILDDRREQRQREKPQ